MNSLLLIRVDADSQQGWGHFMRCLSVAQAWRRCQGEVIFAMRVTEKLIQEMLEEEGFRWISNSFFQSNQESEDAKWTNRLVDQFAPDWLLLDGYHFGECFEGRLQLVQTRLAVFDDNAHSRHASANLIINGNVHATRQMYRDNSPATAVQSIEMSWLDRGELFGPKFLPMRQEFWESPVCTANAAAVPVSKLLVVLGGSPRPGLLKATVRGILRAIAKIVSPTPIRSIQVVAGQSSTEGLRLLNQESQRLGVELSILENSGDVYQRFAGVDLAITAAGSTLYELARLGKPTVAFVVAENQSAGAKKLESMNAIALTANPLLDDGMSLEKTLVELINDSQRREELARNFANIVDGKGAMRIVRRMQFDPIVIRLATANDAQSLFELRNDEEVRQQSFSMEMVCLEKHLTWLKKKTTDPACLLLVAESRAGELIGQIRFDIDAANDVAVVSLSITRQARGLNLAPMLLNRAIFESQFARGVRRLVALVRPDNLASIRSFQSAGFIEQGLETVGGIVSRRFERESGSCKKWVPGLMAHEA